MPAGDLRALWALHQIDDAIHDIRAKAAALDPGRKLSAEIQGLEATFSKLDAEAHRLGGELADLELAQKGIDDRLAKIDKEMYGGTLVSPREIENFEKEIVNLKERRATADEKILALWESAPAARTEADRYRKAIDSKKTQLVEWQKNAMEIKTQLESEFKRQSELRPAAVAKVERALLDKYENIRKKAGTGMARITKENSCGACGIQLPEKVIEYVKDERVTPCEGCNRILYYSTGLF